MRTSWISAVVSAKSYERLQQMELCKRISTVPTYVLSSLKWVTDSSVTETP